MRLPIALLLLSSVPAHAYVQTRTSSGTAVHWPQSCVVVQPDARFQCRARVQIGPSTVFVLNGGWWATWCRVVEATPNGPTRRFDLLEIT